MKMILRWFPHGDDSVTLEQIRQIPGMSGVATCLPKIPVGQVWPLAVLQALRDEINGAGLEMEVIESVNIHEDIKKGLPSRDRYIAAYIETLKNLAAVGVKCLCYNFMPVIDWARSSLTHPLADGSTVLSYRHEQVKALNPASMGDAMLGSAKGYTLPGWEPERLSAMGDDIAFYSTMTTAQYWENMRYFLDAVVPVAQSLDIKMAIHPDDPPWPLYDLPKVITGAENIRTFLALNQSVYNGLTLCTGSLGALVDNDVPALVREFSGMGRVHFAHVRNIKHLSAQDFDETAHLSSCGDLDLFAVMQALHDTGFDGYIRPDHGRMIWGEQARPGYGLYDRAIGANYLLGLWEAITKLAPKQELVLSEHGLSDKSGWAAKGVALPGFDCAAMRAKTLAAPRWLHFGAGNIFRGYIARLQHSLLERGEAETGIIAVEAFDFDIIDQIYAPHNNLSLLVTLLPDGCVRREVVAGIAAGWRTDRDFAELRTTFCDPGLQMVSFTITEKGYSLYEPGGSNFQPAVKAAMEKGPAGAVHLMAITAGLLLERYRSGATPIAMVSMDNCSQNGDKLRSAILTIAKSWVGIGVADEGFVAYLENKVSFPWTMIDKITPRPDRSVCDALLADGIADMEPLVTSRGTYIAPFVNAEAPQYLIVEDQFPNGRPPLEKVGVYLTDRDTVNNTERMKVTTCLNPLHTALAVLGCLLGYTSISEEMRDPDLKTLVERIGNLEGMPVVVHPGIIDPKTFLQEVLTERFPNPFIPDTPQRIACDTSQKLAIRFGETIKSYRDRPELSPTTLTYIPFVQAAWLRYLVGQADDLCDMQLSSDPMLDTLKTELAGIRAGEPSSYTGQITALLHNAKLFGVDLFEVGLADRVEHFFLAMLEGRGAVRNTLKACLKEGRS